MLSDVTKYFLVLENILEIICSHNSLITARRSAQAPEIHTVIE